MFQLEQMKQEVATTCNLRSASELVDFDLRLRLSVFVQQFAHFIKFGSAADHAFVSGIDQPFDSFQLPHGLRGPDEPQPLRSLVLAQKVPAGLDLLIGRRLC